jgi:hypothetical protein
MRQKEKRFGLIGFSLGFAAGLFIGLFYAWVLNPLPPSDTTPAMLEPQDKEVYYVLVAASYANNHNLPLAKQRLAELNDPQIAKTLALTSERFILENKDIRDVRALAILATDMGETSSVLNLYVPTPTLTPVPTSSASPTPSAPPFTSPSAPTRTPTPTVGMIHFRVVQSVALCDQRFSGMLNVHVLDEKGNGLPGQEIAVTWSSGEDHFFTGIKIPADPGFADFNMEDGLDYQVQLAKDGKIPDNQPAEFIADVKADRRALCPDLPANIAPSWQVVFEGQK